MVAERRREEARQKSRGVLIEAQNIVSRHRTPAQANKHLKSKHFKQLLMNAGHSKKLYEVGGPRKGRLLLLNDLREVYWRHHVAAEPTHVVTVIATTPDPTAVSAATPDPTPASPDHTTDDESDSDERGMSEAVPFGMGCRVKVWWPQAKNWYHGVVTAIDQSDSTYEVHYSHDDEYEWHNLSWKAELIE